ncbi:MAG: IS1182 family transposase [Coprococcus comes]
MKTLHNNYCNSKQGYLPLFLSDCLDLLDPVLTFDRLMGGIDLNKYLTDIPEYTTGRLRYNPVNMLKTVLFGFMTSGYCSLRELEDNCKVNIRFMYLMDHQTPSYRTFGYFINEILQDKIENIFNDINHAIFNDEHVDLQHLYIDGSKFEANANKYTWVWKKATEKFRYKLYEKITAEIEEINAEIAWSGVQITTNPEYVPDYLNEIVEQLVLLWELDTSTFVYGSGKRKSKEQRHYEHLTTFCQKLQEYIQKIEICGPNRNSYSKTDNSATFMRIKTDYMGNDQLLPAYNVQIGVADEYIAVVDVNHYRSDMDCFVPLMEHFKQTYGFYPKYPVADAGYGSYNNYIFCEQNGIEKYMKFPMFKKETKDQKYHEDPFRAVNFRIDEQGVMRCPNDKAFHFLYRKNVRGNQYGRKEELYECEDCSGCPYAEKCKKTDKNRTVRINQELTSMHQEVIENLESIHGALLRMNRSIQAEGTFGIMKNDRWYKRIVRRGIHSVKLEVLLVAIGHNLHKYQKKKDEKQNCRIDSKKEFLWGRGSALSLRMISVIYTQQVQKGRCKKTQSSFFTSPFYNIG